MKLNQLKDFMAVANKRSFRAAAREMETTQPAMTRSIQELERDLGVPLFERHARGVGLTPIGERFMVRAGLALAELERARDEVAQLKGLASGTVIACLSAGAQARLLPDALQPFRQRYPGVQLQLIEGLYPAIETGLKTGRIDFFIGPEPALGIESGLLAEPMYENPLVIVGRKGHALAGATSIEELRHAQWLGATMTRQVDNLQELFAQRNLPAPHFAMLCETSSALILALRHTDLLALVPETLAAADGGRALQVIHIRESTAGPRAILVRRSGVPLTPAAEFLCDMMRRSNGYYPHCISPA